MRLRAQHAIAFELVFVFMAVPMPSWGQNPEVPAAFDFSLPGARSRGVGGAFVAIADDATSAYSNPAGLLNLFRPEIAIEGRLWRFTSEVLSGGHAFGQPSGRGEDVRAGLFTEDFEDSTSGLSFLSFAYPAQRWAVGAYYHRLANYEMTQQVGAPFFDCPVERRGPPGELTSYIGLRELGQVPFCERHAIDGNLDRIFPADQSFELEVAGIGGALAYSLTERLSVGFSVQRSMLTRRLTTVSYSVRNDDRITPDKLTKPPIRTPENVDLIATETDISGDNWRWGFNVGTLLDLSNAWSVGAAFRRGPSFSFRADTRVGPGNPTFYVPGFNGFITPEGGALNTLKVPDTIALGVVFRPSDAWRISAEYDRINYGQMIDDLVDVAHTSDSPELPIFIERIRIDDANQIRLGGEYAWMVLRDKVLAVRGGGWYDPQHQLYFVPDDPLTGFPLPRAALNQRKRDGAAHFSAGVGFATRLHFQLDAAVDISTQADTFTVSSVWRF